MQQPWATWPFMKKIQKISILEAYLHFPLHRLIEKSYGFLSNVSGCRRIAVFSTALIAKNWNLDRPRVAAFLFTLIAKNLKPYWVTLQLLFAIHNIFFYTQQVFKFQFLRDLIFFTWIFAHFYISEKNLWKTFL